MHKFHWLFVEKIFILASGYSIEPINIQSIINYSFFFLLLLQFFFLSLSFASFASRDHYSLIVNLIKGFIYYWILSSRSMFFHFR